MFYPFCTDPVTQSKRKKTFMHCSKDTLAEHLAALDEVLVPCWKIVDAEKYRRLSRSFDKGKALSEEFSSISKALTNAPHGTRAYKRLWSRWKELHVAMTRHDKKTSRLLDAQINNSTTQQKGEAT